MLFRLLTTHLARRVPSIVSLGPPRDMKQRRVAYVQKSPEKFPTEEARTKFFSALVGNAEISDALRTRSYADPDTARARVAEFLARTGDNNGNVGKRKGKGKEDTRTSSSTGSNIPVHFARFNRYPTVSTAAPNEHERIIDEEKRFGGTITPDGLCIYKDSEGKQHRTARSSMLHHLPMSSESTSTACTPQKLPVGWVLRLYPCVHV